MSVDQAVVDVLRAAHLVCFAAGMGTSLYFDFRTLRALGHPIRARDIEDLEAVHLWIKAAFGSLWITGMALVYVRTGFDLAAFSPKLWTKLGVMSLMAVNAMMIGLVVLPVLRANLGRPFVEIARRDAVASTQVAMISLFCWSSGLILGSSLVLKTATWSLLLPLGAGGIAVFTILGQASLMLARHKAQSAPAPSEEQLALDLR